MEPNLSQDATQHFGHSQYVTIIHGRVFENISVEDPFWFLKITTDPHILADANIKCPNDSHPKFKDICFRPDIT
jgi:hypothetical protein